MKNIKSLFITVSILVIITGCEDAIDIQQVGRLTPETAFRTVADLQLGLLGAYDEFDITPEIAMGAYTDEVAIGIANGGQGLSNSLEFNLNSTSNAAIAFWLNGYSQLSATNTLIEAAMNITPETGEESTANDILGQLYALRAFSHFSLLSYFTTDYADDNALGIIVLDRVPGIDEKLPRNTNGEVYSLINTDLDLAESLLADNNDPTFVNKDFVTALRARIALYRQDYSTAATYAQQLLDRYPIADRMQYQNMFLDEDNTEIIFKLERVVGDQYDRTGSIGLVDAGGRAGGIYAFTNASITGGPYFEFSRSLFNLFDAADIRFDVNVAPTSIISPDYQNASDFENEDVLVIQKYPGTTESPLLNDLKVFRSSEMLLIIAESHAADGNFNGAQNSTAALIKQLRDARFGTDQPLPSYTDQVEAFKAILNERRVEFAFEGHRYKDVKRLGIRADQNIVRDPLDCAFNGACTLEANDNRLTLPIPSGEIQGNPEIIQNPGY